MSRSRDYLYAHGRLGVLMQNLISETDMNRFIGSPDINTASRMMYDIPLIQGVPGEKPWEEVLDDTLRAVKEETDRMGGQHGKEVLSILWVRYDAPFISWLLKRSQGLTTPLSKKPNPPVTVFPVSSLERLAERPGEADGIPDSLRACAEELLSADSPDARMIDVAVNRWTAQFRTMCAKKSGSRLIVSSVQHNVDLKNVRTALRRPELLSEEFLEGGLLSYDTFSGDPVVLQQNLAQTPYTFVLRSALASSDEQFYLELEHAIASVLRRDLMSMWNTQFGPEELFAYAATAIQQIGVLRSLLVAKRVGISPHILKRSIPPIIPAQHFWNPHE